MPLEKCRKCGFHYIMAKLFSWNDNGTITMRNFPDMRTVIIESVFIDELFSRVEEQMGVSLRHIVFEAQVNASIRAVDTQLSRPLFRQGRKGSFKHIGAWVNSRIPIWSGMGYTHTLFYEPGKRYEAVVANPFNKELLAAIILGSFISLEKRPFIHEWRKVNDHDVLVLEAAESRPEVAERLDIGFPPARPGSLELERCRSCGTPLALSYLRWHEEQGVIIDSRRGVRVTFLDGYVPTLVIRELAAEIGEELYPLVIEAEKDYTKAHIHSLGIADASPPFLRLGGTRRHLPGGPGHAAPVGPGQPGGLQARQRLAAGDGGESLQRGAPGRPHGRGLRSGGGAGCGGGVGEP